MRNLILPLLLLCTPVFAQQLTYPLPIDANRNPLALGVGNPYAFTLTPTTNVYDVAVRYLLPSSGLDTNRVYRHLYILNPSATRTVYVCFGNVSGCSQDSYIVRPGYGLVFEPLRFGVPVGISYVYVRLDAAGSQVIDLSVW